MNFAFKNWKTTLSGIVILLLQVGPTLFPQYITPSVANVISGVAVALGLLAAKDSNVTGGTVANIPNDASVVKESAKSDK